MRRNIIIDSCVHSGKRALEYEVGEIQLLCDSLLKETELCKIFWYVHSKNKCDTFIYSVIIQCCCSCVFSQYVLKLTNWKENKEKMKVSQLFYQINMTIWKKKSLIFCSNNNVYRMLLYCSDQLICIKCLHCDFSPEMCRKLQFQCEESEEKSARWSAFTCSDLINVRLMFSLVFRTLGGSRLPPEIK